jgi:hypothetical protein
VCTPSAAAAPSTIRRIGEEVEEDGEGVLREDTVCTFVSL